MPDIKKLTVNGVSYDIKDEPARDLLENINDLVLTDSFTMRLVANYINSDEYPTIQGACYYNDKIYAAFSQPDNTTSCKIKIINPETFAEEKSLVINGGHPNSLCVVEDIIYIGDTQNNRIITINPDTLTINEIYEVSYMPIGICYNGENLSVVGQGSILYTVDPGDPSDIIEQRELETHYEHGANQLDIECAEDLYVMCTSAPSTIYIYNNNFELMRVLDIPERYPNFSLMETENIMYLGENNWMIGINNYLSPYSSKRETAWITTNFYIGEPDNDQQQIYQGYSPNRKVSIYIDINYTGTYSDGSQTRPFKELQQAVNNINREAALYLLYTKAGTYDPLYTVDKTWEIMPYDSTVTLTNIIIPGIHIVGGTGYIGQTTLRDGSTGQLNGLALFVEYGGRAVTASQAASQYHSKIGSGGTIENQSYMQYCTWTSGMLLSNSRAGHYNNLTKSTGAAKLLGRRGLITTSTVNETVTLAEQTNNYVILHAMCSFDGIWTTGIIRPTGKTVIPVHYSYNENLIEGYVLFTASNSTTLVIETVLTKWTGTGWTAYTPNSPTIEIDGIL